MVKSLNKAIVLFLKNLILCKRVHIHMDAREQWLFLQTGLETAGSVRLVGQLWEST